MKKARAEQHRTVLPIGHNQAITRVLFQKCYNAGLVGVVVLDLPTRRRRLAADDKATVRGIEVGFRWRDPEVYADGGIVSVGVDSRLRLQAFEGPSLDKGVPAENVGECLPELVGDLKEQRASQSVFEIGRDEALDMDEV